MIFGMTTICMAVLEMIDKITNAMDSNSFSIGIFIDFSKAFDTRNYNILFDKLEHFDVHGVPYNVLYYSCTIVHNMLFITVCNLQSYELNATSHRALY